MVWPAGQICKCGAVRAAIAQSHNPVHVCVRCTFLWLLQLRPGDRADFMIAVLCFAGQLSSGKGSGSQVLNSVTV